MMSHLGAYITSEYAVLLNVFSFLSSKDLSSAAQVCREWERVASRITQKRNRPTGYYRAYKKKWSKLDKRLQPKVILHFSSRPKNSDFYSLISEAYNLEDTSIYHIRNANFIGSEYSDDSFSVKSRLGKTQQAFLALCDMPGVTINSFCISSEVSKKNYEDSLSLATADPRCLLIIAGGNDTDVLVDFVFSSFSKCSPLIIVGGVADYAPVLRQSPFKKFERADSSALCLTFHGKNIIPHAALHELNINIDFFMTKLSTDIGPLPTGGYRIAFIFSCINLLEIVKDTEIEVFKSYFPNVPLYGLWSYGEYMTFLNDSSLEFDPTMRRDWAHSECTSYLILTFKKDS